MTMTLSKVQLDLLRSLTGKTPYTDAELERLLAHVKDADLLASALTMSPRPAWVHEVATGRRTR